MYSIPITQADLGAAAATIFSSHAEGGLYVLHAVFHVNSLSGSGDAQLNLNWTEQDGLSAQIQDGFQITNGARYVYDRVITLDHPSNFQFHLVNQGFSGSFSGTLEVFVARLKEEG